MGEINIEDLVMPKTLYELKSQLNLIDDKSLEQQVVFRFVWGDTEGYSDFKRKETSNQYRKRKLKDSL